MSTIILKSWPKDDKGNYLEEEEVVLKHLLGWTAAKNIFQLHGNYMVIIIIWLLCLPLMRRKRHDSCYLFVLQVLMKN